MWINSPGGDCVAAAQIYNMLTNYKGKVTVKIDGIAASAASVIAMAGNEVYMSPVSMMMIHNHATVAWGDHTEFAIIIAYVLKTGLSRAKLSHLMDSETWMNDNKAVELGFADGMFGRGTTNEEGSDVKVEDTAEAVMFSRKAVNNTLQNKISAKFGKKKTTVVQQSEIPAPETKGHSVDEIMERLDTIKKFM